MSIKTENEVYVDIRRLRDDIISNYYEQTRTVGEKLVSLGPLSTDVENKLRGYASNEIGYKTLSKSFEKLFTAIGEYERLVEITEYPDFVFVQSHYSPKQDAILSPGYDALYDMKRLEKKLRKIKTKIEKKPEKGQKIVKKALNPFYLKILGLKPGESLAESMSWPIDVVGYLNSVKNHAEVGKVMVNVS